jgi:hypothetical protein
VATSDRIRREGSNSRFYLIDGVKYPSVTTILSVINKPALVPWAAKMEREACTLAATELYAEIAARPQLPRSMYVLALEQRLGQAKAHQKALAAAAEIGTAAHAAVEHSLRTALGQHVGPAPILADAALWALMSWQDFARDVQLVPQAIEQVVYSRDHRYAGTLDLVATLDAGALLSRLERQGPVATSLGDWLRQQTTVRAVVDIKTGRSIYPESSLQAVAYERALAEMGHGRVDGALIVRLPKITSDPEFEVAVVPPARELFATFLAVRQLWTWVDAQEQLYRTRRKVA